MRKALFLLGMLAACGDDGPGMTPDAPPAPDAAIDAPVPACAPLTGAGTMHTNGTVNTDETWTAATSPHIITADTSITANLTLEPCAVVRIAGGRQISVRATGRVIADGTATMPIRIERQGTTPWVNLRTLNGGAMTFSYTTIDGGGDPLNGNAQTSAMLDIAGAVAGAPQGVLYLDHVTLTNSKSCGVALHDGGGFAPGSREVTISGSMVAPITTFARALDTIPSGTYTGNTEDAIIIQATGGPEAMVESATIRNRGVPYRVGIQPNATLDVGPVTGLATVTIEPGVTMKFSAGAQMRVDASGGTQAARGALIANGTTAQPIVFTSAVATPAAGDWYGLYFGGTANATTKLDHVRVEFAGKVSASGSDSCLNVGQTAPNDAAIRIVSGAPATVFITNSEIVSSLRHGIDRGFRSDTKPSFLPTNTFTNVAACKESYPRDVSGACPTTPPCP